MSVSVVKNALDVAAVIHNGQFRKYPNPTSEVPYMSHVAGVGIILGRHGFDSEVIAAGILHDSLEDCPDRIEFEDIEYSFGPRIANLVKDCSEADKSLPWQERKDAYMEAFDHKCWEAQAIAIADKIDNFESIVACAAFHGNPWPTFKFGKEVQLKLFDKMGDKLKKLQAHPIIDEYFEVLEKVRNVDEPELTVRNSPDSQIG